MPTLVVVSADRAAGVVIAVNARSNSDPNLLRAAETLLCTPG